MITEKNSDEVSMHDIFSGIRLFFRFLVNNWIAVLLAIVIGGVSGYYFAKLSKPEYTADLTFVLSSESKSGGLSSLANQFGLDFGSNSGNDVFSGENIITLFKSKKMIRLVLFKTPPENNESLINIFIKNSGLEKKWKENERTKNLIPFPKDYTQLSPIQDSLFREVYNIIVSKQLSVFRPDKKLSVYQVSTTSTEPVFSCYLTKYLMDETADFYIETKTSISKKNLRMLQREADSLRGLLGNAITTTASESQRTFNLNPALQQERAPAQKSQVRATVLTTAYGEVVKNLEIAKVSLQKETPLYQIIDEPSLPLKAQKRSGLIWALAGAFVATIIVIIILFIRKK